MLYFAFITIIIIERTINKSTSTTNLSFNLLKLPVSNFRDLNMKYHLIVIFSLLAIANGYKILFLVPFPGPSHWFLLQTFVKELVNRGHDVTAIVNKKINNFSSPNYTEILIDPSCDLGAVFSIDELFIKHNKSDFDTVHIYDTVATPSSAHGLKDPNVQQIIHSKDLHFDLVINEEFFHESWLMFGYKFNAPVVTICTYGYSDFFDRAMGMLTPYSHIAHMILPYGDDMSYSERVYNLVLSAYDWMLRNWVMLPKQNQIAQQFFGHLAETGKPLPTVQELYRNISLILTNTHRSTSKPRPQMPGIINIGGAHIKPPKPLPKDLKDFLDKSTNGVIFFSLGSFLQSTDMPKEKIAIFFDVFSKLKQNIIWKFEDDSLTNIPSNVKIAKWLPQSDILAHPNVVLFISHGGMSGTFEGTARGVPMLFIPLFGDQMRNSLKSVASGNALQLPFTDITAESLSATLNELLTNKAYTNRAKELAHLFNDNLVHPMEEAMFWIEYVARNKGAKHLKSNVVNMSWFSYLMLDIFLAPFAVIFITYLAIKYLSRKNIDKNHKK